MVWIEGSFRVGEERKNNDVVMRELPSLQQVKKDIKIRVGERDYVLLSKETVVPINKRLVRWREKVLNRNGWLKRKRMYWVSCMRMRRLESWRWSEGIMNRILLKENACGKEMNIHIKGSATEGICFTIQIPNEGIDREGRWCVEEFIIHLQEEQNWFVCCKILFFNRIQIHSSFSFLFIFH